jgi:hypothetical protein
LKESEVPKLIYLTLRMSSTELLLPPRKLPMSLSKQWLHLFSCSWTSSVDVQTSPSELLALPSVLWRSPTELSVKYFELWTSTKSIQTSPDTASNFQGPTMTSNFAAIFRESCLSVHCTLFPVKALHVIIVSMYLSYFD